MDALRKNAINRLMERRERLQREYDELLAQPVSYGITGSVNAVNHGLKELREEIALIDDKIASMFDRTSVAGMSVRWPNYRHMPVGGGIY